MKIILLNTEILLTVYQCENLITIKNEFGHVLIQRRKNQDLYLSRMAGIIAQCIKHYAKDLHTYTYGNDIIAQHFS